MKITHDKAIDAKYFLIKKEKIFRTFALSTDLIADLNEKGEIIGIELLNATSEKGMLAEHNIKEGLLSSFVAVY